MNSTLLMRISLRGRAGERAEREGGRETGGDGFR